MQHRVFFSSSHGRLFGKTMGVIIAYDILEIKVRRSILKILREWRLDGQKSHPVEPVGSNRPQRDSKRRCFLLVAGEVAKTGFILNRGGKRA